jgi:hypothetical protein
MPFIELTIPIWERTAGGHKDDRDGPRTLKDVRRVTVNSSEILSVLEINPEAQKLIGIKALTRVVFRRQMEFNGGCSERNSAYVLESRADIDGMLGTRQSHEDAGAGENRWWDR